MKHFLLTGFIVLAILIQSFSTCYSQDKKLDFTAAWKTDTLKNVINISIIGESGPYNCYVYESSPFNGGKPIKIVENIETKVFNIEMAMKEKVFICVYKNEDIMAAKWVNIRK